MGNYFEGVPFGATATGEDGSTWFGGSSGPVQTGQGTPGTDAAGYASAIGGGTKALVGLMFGNRQLKMQKRITGIQHQQTREQFKGAMKDSSVGEMGAMRDYSRGSQDMRAQLAAQGQGNSSAMGQANEDMKYQRDLKINAIQRQRALMSGGMDAQEKVWDLEKKQARAAQQEAAISAGIDTAISVAGAFSDQRLKRNFGPVEAREVLDKLDRLPVSTWTYEWEKDGVRHMGPMAQDFHRIFELGQPITDRPASIAYVDLFGVLLASIQALSAKVKQLEATVKMRK